MSEVQGVVVTDAQGLCLKADGDLQYVVEANSAGFFSTIVEKAAVLGDESEQPTVRLETTTRSLVVTRVGERTIAVSQANGVAGSEL